jgi:hypothetical protein
VDLHRLAELRSLAYHRAIAERLATDPNTLSRARDRVARWKREETVHPHYVELWEQLLARPIEQIVAALVDESAQRTALRQVSPFAGALSPKERWAIWRAVRA